MLSVIYAVWHLRCVTHKAPYAECRYAECRGTDKSTAMLGSASFIL